MALSTITAIEPQRKPGRYSVFVNGEFVVGVAEKVLADLQLKVGQTISPEVLEKTAAAEEENRAMEGALRLLDIRARTQSEIKTRLRTKGYEPRTIESVLARLTNLDLINDAAFATQFIKEKSNPNSSRPAGRRKTAMDLYAKGVGKEIISDTLALVSEDDELAAARAVLKKRFRGWPDKSDARKAEYAKIISLLQRRGFSWNTIKPAMEELDAPPEDEEWE